VAKSQLDPLGEGSGFNYREFHIEEGDETLPRTVCIIPRLRRVVSTIMAPRKGYSHGYYHGGHLSPGLLSRQTKNEVLSSRIQRESFNVTHSLFTLIAPRFQYHVEEVEAVVQQERTMNKEHEVAVVTICWIPDVGTTRARDTKYWKTIELYWHIKNLLGQILQTREEAQNTMQL
jgi:hypothetical protein